jgi:hypothetical protein
MPRAAFLLMMCLGVVAHASPPAATTDAVQRISAVRPCAAVALLYVIHNSDAASSGTLYLTEIPTPHVIAYLGGLEDGGAGAFPLQPNVYGDARYYIEVRWSLVRLNRDVRMVTAEAELVDAAGVKFKPSHPIEPLTRVLIVGETLRVLPSAAVE